MSTYAIIKNNQVTEVRELTEEQLHEELKSAQLAIDITNTNPVPQVGWILDGNTLVQAPDQPAIVPDFVTPRQIRIALIMSGNQSILDSIPTVIASLPEPNRSIATITWEYSNEVFRNNPLLNLLAPALGVTSEDLDNLFILAKTI